MYILCKIWQLSNHMVVPVEMEAIVMEMDIKIEVEIEMELGRMMVACGKVEKLILESEYKRFSLQLRADSLKEEMPLK